MPSRQSLALSWSALLFAFPTVARLQAEERRPNILIVHCHDLRAIPALLRSEDGADAESRFAGVAGGAFFAELLYEPWLQPLAGLAFYGPIPAQQRRDGAVPCQLRLGPASRRATSGPVAPQRRLCHGRGWRDPQTRSGYQRCGYERYLPQASARPAVDATIRLLREFRDRPGKPFFLCAGFIEPHRLPYPKADWPGALPGDHSFPGPALQPDDSLGVEVPGYLRDTEGTPARAGRTAEVGIRHVDSQFGRLVAALKETGLESNTLLLFTTDHGVGMPRAKCSLNEPGVQVALLMRLPNRSGWHGGIVHPEMISNVDYLPTILELAREDTDTQETSKGGRSRRCWTGKAYRPRREIYELTYHDYYDPHGRIQHGDPQADSRQLHDRPLLLWTLPSAGVRRPTPRCRRTPPPAQHPDIELYDLARDPWEQKDVAAKPAYAATGRIALASLPADGRNAGPAAAGRGDLAAAPPRGRTAGRAK